MAAVFALRIVVVIHVLLQNGLTLETLVPIVMIIPYVCAATLGAGNVFKRTETVQLMNSGRSTLECLQKATGRHLSGFGDMSLSLKIIGVSFIAVLFSVMPPVLPFLFPDLPILYLS